MSQTILTTAGLDKLKAELVDLKEKRRPAVIARIKEAVSHGDLSENSEYEDAKNEQGFIEGRIAELDAMLEDAQIVSAKSGSTVELGSTVAVTHDGKKSSFTIVGPAEADPTSGLISNESPLGAALLGSTIGDSVSVATPRGETTYAVMKIGS
jgi:transcription elongation factor GreA